MSQLIDARRNDTPAPGQIWRDRRWDRRDQSLSRRTVKVLSERPDGKWQCEGVTDYDGSPIERPRRSSIATETLQQHFRLQTNVPMHEQRQAAPSGPRVYQPAEEDEL